MITLLAKKHIKNKNYILVYWYIMAIKFDSHQDVMNFIKDDCQKRNIKYMDITNLSFINFANLHDKIKTRKDIIAVIDCSKCNIEIIFALFKKHILQHKKIKNSDGSIQHISHNVDYKSYVYIMLNKYGTSLNIHNTSSLYITSFIEKNINSTAEPAGALAPDDKCNICYTVYNTDKHNHITACPTCNKDMCYNCIIKNYTVNNKTDCPFCKTEDFISFDLKRI